MYCPYCGYGQLPSNAPCCYMCGHAGPYSSDPPSVTRSGLQRQRGECPHCRSRNSTSGADNLKNDVPVALLVSAFTLGMFLVFFIPYLLIRGATKHYNTNRYWCINCKHVWDE
jgi:hypothetical protein